MTFDGRMIKSVILQSTETYQSKEHDNKVEWIG